MVFLMQTTNLYSGQAAQAIDQLAINQYGYDSFSLMTRAGESAFAQLQAHFELARPALLILCGCGNNGGDGYVLGRCAIQAGCEVTLIAGSSPKTTDAQRARAEFESIGGVCSGKPVLKEAEFDVVIDALLGTGLKSAPRGDCAELIELANQLSATKCALDVPSGVNADTGNVYSPAFSADLTVTFIVPKLGLMTGAALNFVGKVVLEDLAVERKIIAEVAPCARLIAQPKLPIRTPDSHKGSYGHTLIAGGAPGMYGAALLAGESALFAGSGKVSILSTPDNLDRAALYRPELMSREFNNERDAEAMQGASSLVLGPGLGLGHWSRQLFTAGLSVAAPKVIDADALTLLANSPQALSTPCVLTPHPGEAARLLATSTHAIQEDRASAAKEIAERYSAVCILKGAGTIIATPAGEVVLCDRGNAGMATAGMGDVLSGMVGALLAQGYDIFAAACTGVFWHADTADRLIKETSRVSLLAGDVSRNLRL